MNLVRPYRNKVSDKYKQAAYIVLISLIPVTDRSDQVLKECATLCNDRYFVDQVFNIRKQLSLLAPSDMTKVLRYVLNDPALLKKPLANLFRKDPLIAPNAYRNLSELLDQVAASREESNKVSKEIIDSINYLGLDEDHPLVQKAFRSLYDFGS